MSKKFKTDEIIEMFKKVHGNKYDYSKVEYTKMHDKVIITCPIHGEFKQEAHAHLKGQGCPKCGIEARSDKRKDNKKQFIEKAMAVHGDKYDYSEVNYIDSQTKVCIICPKHGEFWQMPYSHIGGQGCPKCYNEERKRGRIKTLEQFIGKAIAIHGDKYDYSKVEYTDCMTKVCIICPKHGEFWQTPSSHLQGKGCKKCGIEKTHSIMSNEKFIEKARAVHGDKYDYSKTKYKSPFEYVTITCKKHGDFIQKASYHLSGNGCSKCGYEKVKENLSYTTEHFIEQAKKIHGDKYDYSKVNYVNNHTKVCIICPKHGDFWVTPYNFLYNKSGCPRCSTSKLEIQIQNVLTENKIKYESQKEFKWLKNDITNYPMRYDIYIPSKNLAIECQGQQHIESCGMFDDVIVEKIKHRDEVKNKLSNENGIELLYLVDKRFYKKALDCSLYNKKNLFTDIKKLLIEIIKK